MTSPLVPIRIKTCGSNLKVLMLPNTTLSLAF